MSYVTHAKQLRPIIEKAVQSLPDSEAVASKTLYPKWEDLVKLGSVTSEVGYKFRYDGELYKCRNANPKFSAEWVPGIDTAALYERIDEKHAGTFGDPIPYNGNMTLVIGKYYSQDGVVYECIEGTGIPVYDKLANLPRYVRVATEPEHPGKEYPEWVSGQKYAKFDKVSHNGKRWESQVDNNVWEPGYTGIDERIWKEVNE